MLIFITGVQMNLKDSLQKVPITHVNLSFYIETEKGTKVGAVLDKMRASHRKCALVMDHGKLIGIFTERDIVVKVAGKLDVVQKPIDELMTPSPITMDAGVTVVEASRHIASTPHRYIPVVNKEGVVLGTVTYYAIIKYISDYFPQEIYNLPPVPDLYATSRDGA
jgi:predicted transcriptional regulator